MFLAGIPCPEMHSRLKPVLSNAEGPPTHCLDEVKRDAGVFVTTNIFPDYALLHPGYSSVQSGMLFLFARYFPVNQLGQVVQLFRD
jgi:hypothetical protein